MNSVDDIEVWWKRLGCIRNPGTHTGEESARDAEIKELRQALAERVSHLELLKKYMKLIVACEGITFVGHIGDYGDSPEFTKEEISLLREMALDLNDEYRDD